MGQIIRRKDVNKKGNETVLILADLRSAHNVGSIFRTAEGAGVSKIYLCGTTPAPIDRFGRPRADMAKVALGAERSVLWESKKDAISAIRDLKREGFYIVAFEQNARAKNYLKVRPCRKTVLILGNEVSGLSKKILRLADKVAEIPMYGAKESLNVSVVAGIALFHLTR